MSTAILTTILWACAPPPAMETPPAPVPAPRLPAPQPVPPFQTPADIRPLATIDFTIQVGAFSTPERAAAYALKLQSFGLDAYYFIDDDGFSKVRFERHRDKAAARRRALDLRGQGIIDSFYVVAPGETARRRKTDAQATLRQALVHTAKRYVGTPYRWGGESARTGFDCSGLTMTVYRLNGLDLPRNSRAQFDAGVPISRSALKKGDLVFFYTGRKNRVSHVGIYTGSGNFIHAPRRGKTIRISALASDYYRKRYMGARRYF
jgi:hypothetical protein